MKISTGSISIEQASNVREIAERIMANVGKVIVGKKEVIELELVAILSGGNLLLEDVPGVGKTMLARATAKSLGCSFQRIQCTPDLLPSDVTGIQFYNQKECTFEFRPGPIMTNIVLVDEINRATPRTQSALLEAMQEHQITVDMETFPLPRPFLLMATQNPVELEGTFPLPEAQLDRFMLRIRMGYPSENEEAAILSRFQQENPLDNLPGVTDAEELLEMQRLCRQVFVEESVSRYIVALIRASRAREDLKLAASPRASLSLFQGSQALAAIRGRRYVIPDDVKYLAVAALAHRLIVKTEARLRGHSSEAIVQDILAKVPVPAEPQ
jgi:MoxR-like ATPase